MIAAAYGSISDIEILWVLIAGIGLAYSCFNIASGRGDMKWLRENAISNGRRTLAVYQLVAEFLRATIQSIFVVIGVLAMFLPEPPPQRLNSKQAWIGFCIRWGIILSSALLTVKSFLGKRVRDILRGR